METNVTLYVKLFNGDVGYVMPEICSRIVLEHKEKSSRTVLEHQKICSRTQYLNTKRYILELY